MLTDAGKDWKCRVMGDTSSDGSGDYASATYIGLTEDTVAPAGGDTTLTDEIGSGTLARSQAVYAHTNGTSTYTLTKLFTADGSYDIAKLGVFNAASGGTMVFEQAISPVRPVQNGDQFTVTVTVDV